MNILITLPKDLIEKIISGEKKLEMRKCLPKLMKIGEDGFLVVEKGTDIVRCWCQVDKIKKIDINMFTTSYYSKQLCVSVDYINQYAQGKAVYLWKIGKVIVINKISRYYLGIDKNPQQFVYCKLNNNLIKIIKANEL